MTNEQLVLRIRAGENVADNMLQLWQKNQGLICRIAWSLGRKDEYEDLCQQGYLGLCEAVRLFYPDEGVPFANYAAYWIRAIMQRYLENSGSCVRLPVHIHLLVNQYKRVLKDFVLTYGREPSRSDLCAALLINTEKLDEVRKAASLKDPSSLAAPVGDDSGAELGDLVADPRDQEDEIMERLTLQELAGDLWQAVDQLQQDEKDVIMSFYKGGESMKHIADRHGISVSSCRRIHNRACNAIRFSDISERLYSYIGDDSFYYNEGMKGTSAKTFDRSWTSATERAAIG